MPGDGVDGYALRAGGTAGDLVHPMAPRDWSAAESSTLTTAGLTAWRALVGDGGLKAGDTVLVLGTGGVAIFGLQLAKAMGASVIMTSSSDEKLARARALGADHTLNYRSIAGLGRRGAQAHRRPRRRSRAGSRRSGNAATVDCRLPRRRADLIDRYADRFRGPGARRAP